MPQEIRIAVDVAQQTEKGVPVTGHIWDEANNEVPIYLKVDDPAPVKQPFDIEGGGCRIFTPFGGNFHGKFWWTAADKQTREFEQDLEVPEPPACPRCEERVPELVDYLCEKCRYG